MEKTNSTTIVIYYFLNANYRLYKDNSVGKYYVCRLCDNVHFDLSKNYLSDTKGKYISNDTRKELTRNIIVYINKGYVLAEYSEDLLEYMKKYYDIDNYEFLENKEKENKEKESKESESMESNKTNQLLEKLIDKVENQNNFVNENIMSTIADKLLSVKSEEVSKKIVDNVDNYIKTTYGNLPQRHEFVFDDTTVTVDGIFHKEMDNIIKFIKADIPIVLSGPAGSGKNYTLEKAAEILNMDFYFTNAITQEYKLTGFIDANGKYQETQFYKAFKNGGVFFLDEIDASIPEALIVLNAAIANKYFDFPCGRIDANENFRVVAAANTYGTGADMIYVGRNVLDGATLDRFAVIKFDYDERVEQAQCPDEELYKFCIELRNAIESKKLRFIISIRAMMNAYKMLGMKFSYEYIIKTAITKSMSKDDVESIKNDISNGKWKDALLNNYKTMK